nr:MAG TPA: type I neck protein [Caudoviricetes sp.]
MADLVWDPSQFVQSCEQYRSKFLASVLLVCEIASTKMEAYAKSNAIWTDRTGNARQKLKGEAAWVSKDQIMIAVSHHMSYGFWLELAHGRKYKILEQSIEDNVEELFRALRRLVD